MATKGLSGLKDANLRFINVGWNGMAALQRYLQAFFGDVRGKVRLVGQATVISGQTTVVVTDANILATDEVFCQIITQGASAGTFVSAVTISAATSFTITVNQNPGAGGAVINYQIVRLMSAV